MPAGFVIAVDASCTIAPAPALDAPCIGWPNSRMYRPPADAADAIDVMTTIAETFLSIRIISLAPCLG